MSKNCFSPDQVRNSGEWRKIRELASDALRAFGWPLSDRKDATMSSFQARRVANLPTRAFFESRRYFSGFPR